MTYSKSLPVLLLLLCASCFTASAQHDTVDDPDPLRFEEQIEQFKAWDRRNSFPSDAILFVGSSSIRLWETAAAFPEMPVINRGFGGSHTSDVQHYYEAVIGNYDPALIVFYEGDNDIASGKPVKQVFHDYRQLVHRILNDQPGVDFLYIPIKPSSSRQDDWPEMSEVNRLIKKYNATHAQLHYVDLATPLLKADGKPDDRLFLDDQLHLNKKGYEKWNNVIRPVLERMVSQPQ